MSDKQDTSKMVWYQQGNRKAIALAVATVFTIGSVAGVQAFAISQAYKDSLKSRLINPRGPVVNMATATKVLPRIRMRNSAKCSTGVFNKSTPCAGEGIAVDIRWINLNSRKLETRHDKHR